MALTYIPIEHCCSLEQVKALNAIPRSGDKVVCDQCEATYEYVQMEDRPWMDYNHYHWIKKEKE